MPLAQIEAATRQSFESVAIVLSEVWGVCCEVMSVEGVPGFGGFALKVRPVPDGEGDARA